MTRLILATALQKCKNLLVRAFLRQPLHLLCVMSVNKGLDGLYGGIGPGGPPREVDFNNGWFGYRLTLRTLAFNRLPESSGGDAGAAD